MSPKPNILVVDDEPNIIESFRFAFDEEYLIDGAGSGEEAIEKVKQAYYDLVILDIILPGLNGVDVLKRIKDHDRRLEVIMITATQTVKTAIKSMKLGAFDYFTKPFDLDEVQETINSALEKSRQSKETDIYRLLAGTARQEREKIQEQLAQLQKMEAMGQMTGGVVHDFNNLLTIIQGNAEMGLMKVPESDPIREELEKIQKAAERSSELTRQLLFFTRKEEDQTRALDLNKAIEESLQLLKRVLGEDIRVYTRLEKGLSAIRADPGNIHQVVMNLAVNARDAMPFGGILSFTTQCVAFNADQLGYHPHACPGNYVCITVVDSGMGIEKEKYNRIFEPFYTTKDPGKGTGLGLAVVYGIIRQYRGWITVESLPRHYTIFRLYLPQAGEVIKEEPVELPVEKAEGPAGGCVLVVEDDTSIRNFVVKVLAQDGYQVLQAGTAQEAMDILSRPDQAIDLVFSDMVLPDRSGVQLYQEMMAACPDLKVLFSSGYSDDRSEWEIIKKQGLPFLAKPYSVEQLLQAVRLAVL